jgi:hypothetical protein
MNEADEIALIAKAVKELGINRPIMSHRVVGDRLELHLYGGDTLTYAIAEAPETPLFLMSKKELIELAEERGIKVTSRMTKSRILAAIEAKN